MKTYAEKLRDPRWQRMRLKVFERDGFCCVRCGGAEKTLHVHHLSYKKQPWDSPESDLTTLCEDCHEFVEGCCKAVRKLSAGESFGALMPLIFAIDKSDFQQALTQLSYLQTEIKSAIEESHEKDTK